MATHKKPSFTYDWKGYVILIPPYALTHTRAHTLSKLVSPLCQLEQHEILSWVERTLTRRRRRRRRWKQLWGKGWDVWLGGGRHRGRPTWQWRQAGQDRRKRDCQNGNNGDVKMDSPSTWLQRFGRRIRTFIKVEMDQKTYLKRQFNVQWMNVTKTTLKERLKCIIRTSWKRRKQPFTNVEALSESDFFV